MTNKKPGKEGEQEEAYLGKMCSICRRLFGDHRASDDACPSEEYHVYLTTRFSPAASGGEEKRFTGNEKEMLEFVMYVTGNTEKTVLQIYRDWLNNKIYQ